MAKLNLPSFWYATDDNDTSPIMSKALWPISKLYRAGCVFNNVITRQKKSPLPIICIGNLTMGGAGKTPTARAIMKLVEDHDKFHTICFMMRGYGGRNKGPVEVDPTIHTAWDVGDEALMQARYAHVIVASNRYEGAVLAQSQGYDLIIMDDGFQNPQLEKDLSFIVVDGGFGFGNGSVFPSGPLREPVKNGTKRANAAIIVNRQDGIDLSALGRFKQYDADIKIHTEGLEDNASKKIIAFAGIARPEKFFDSLETNGYHLHAHYAYPDHHVYTHGDLDKLVLRAKKANAQLITTEKDWIRLSNKWRDKVSYLKISIELDDRFKQALVRALDKL